MPPTLPAFDNAVAYSGFLKHRCISLTLRSSCHEVKLNGKSDNCPGVTK